jgi:hypothetical protein
MFNLLRYTFTVLAAWSAIDHEYVAAFAVAAIATAISLTIETEGRMRIF